MVNGLNEYGLSVKMLSKKFFKIHHKRYVRHCQTYGDLKVDFNGDFFDNIQ